MKSKKHSAQIYGRKAETLAAWYLRGKGYRILATNMRNHGGEIDIIALHRGLVIAIEVKARQNLTDCSEAVPPTKQARIARALEGYLATQAGQIAYHGLRFDVIWMSPRRWPVHIKDAWRM